MVDRNKNDMEKIAYIQKTTKRDFSSKWVEADRKF